MQVGDKVVVTADGVTKGYLGKIIEQRFGKFKVIFNSGVPIRNREGSYPILSDWYNPDELELYVSEGQKIVLQRESPRNE